MEKGNSFLRTAKRTKNIKFNLSMWIVICCIFIGNEAYYTITTNIWHVIPLACQALLLYGFMYLLNEVVNEETDEELNETIEDKSKTIQLDESQEDETSIDNYVEWS